MYICNRPVGIVGSDCEEDKDVITRLWNADEISMHHSAGHAAATAQTGRPAGQAALSNRPPTCMPSLAQKKKSSHHQVWSSRPLRCAK